MKCKAALLVPLALSLSAAALAEPVALAERSHLTPEAAETLKLQASPGRAEGWLPFDAQWRDPEAKQVRIERRVIVRIAPRSPAPRQSLMAELPQQATPRRMVERKMEDCVNITDIAGVQTTSSDKLLLYLRDRRIVSAKLERSCQSRDYYSGFYLERNEDGRLCVNRDKLQSRSGAKCEIDRIRQLVPEGD